MVARKYLVKRVSAWQVVDTPNIFTNNARRVSLLDFFLRNMYPMELMKVSSYNDLYFLMYMYTQIHTAQYKGLAGALYLYCFINRITFYWDIK